MSQVFTDGNVNTAPVPAVTNQTGTKSGTIDAGRVTFFSASEADLIRVDNQSTSTLTLAHSNSTATPDTSKYTIQLAAGGIYEFGVGRGVGDVYIHIAGAASGDIVGVTYY